MRADSVRWTVRGAGFAAGAGGVVLAAFVASRSATAILLVFLGVLLAATLEPLVARLRRRLGLSRLQAIAVVYLVFFAIVVGVVLLVVPPALVQAERVMGRLPEMLDQAAAWSATIRPEALGETLGRFVESLRGTLVRASDGPATDDVVEAGVTAAELAISVSTVLVVVAFWLIERPRIQRYVLAFLPPLRRAGGRTAWNRAERRLGRWARGQLILMSIVGAAAAIAYSLLGLPSAILLGLIAGIFEVIPLIGPLLGAIPAVLVALTISPTLALAVIIVYALIQLVEGHVLVPMVMRRAVGLSPLLVLISLLVGTALAGIIGALVAVPAAALIEILIEPLQARAVPVTTDPRGDVDQEQLSGDDPGPAADGRPGGVARPEAATDVLVGRISG